METPIILAACRTPMGKYRGSLATCTAPQLGATAIRAALERSGVSPDQVDEVIMGNVVSAGLGQAPARQAALAAGLPARIGALTINKVCGSGLKAIALAAQAIRTGEATVVVAGGMESMSRTPYLLARDDVRLGHRQLSDALLLDGLECAMSRQSMGVLAERLAQRDNITRSDQDQFANDSHRRAIAANQAGAFDAERVPVVVRTRQGEVLISHDEGPRSDSTIEQLAGLPPAFESQGTVTAGNASIISDGAAALVIASQTFAAAHGRIPRAEIVATVTAGTEPEDLFIAPVLAIEQLLRRCGRTLPEIDLFEVNEAFAAQMLACQRRLKLPEDRVNIHGGAIALGHPIGASGARVAVTLLHALDRQQKEFGVAALCLGGGNAVATLFRRLD